MALLNRDYLKTLVSIGVMIEKRKKMKFRCLATGFLVGIITRDSKYPEKRGYSVFLVTNRHVFRNKDHIFLRMNIKGGGSKIFREELISKFDGQKWLAHTNPKVDAAVYPIGWHPLQRHNIDFKFINEEDFANYHDFEKIGIEAGDGVYILGFPMGLAGNFENYACAKWGIVSRIDKEIIKSANSFLIDTSIFPGNSGNPVILKPEVVALPNTKNVPRTYLIGVISRYIPYTDELFSHQTEPPLVVSTSTENSGLTFVVPMDYVKQICNKWIKEKKKEKRNEDKILAKK